uniref:Sidoreflexin n=1 Tax=Pelusios castaneus TaxID=367368 RepID=A0A8C8RA51_9SAUR
MVNLTNFSIDAPRWDQNTFVGRLKHFFNITDPRTVLVSERELDRAKGLVESCRAGLVPPGTSREQLFYAKKLYDSAFHPDSGEKMNLIGRMSFQVPGGMAITGCMLQFYRTVPAVVFWQWVNQSFNALVNYTNRNAACPLSLTQIGVAYVTATSTALATAVGLNLYTKRAPPLVARWVPFAAVAAANCVNIPMMRQQELINGIAVTDNKDVELGNSRVAAAKGIAQVVISRIAMAAPGMVLLPILMERLEKLPFMKVSGSGGSEFLLHCHPLHWHPVHLHPPGGLTSPWPGCLSLFSYFPPGPYVGVGVLSRVFFPQFPPHPLSSWGSLGLQMPLREPRKACGSNGHEQRTCQARSGPRSIKPFQIHGGRVPLPLAGFHAGCGMAVGWRAP